MPNDRDAAETNLALLVHTAGAAATAAEKRQALNQLEAFSQKTPFAELRTRADEASAIASAATRQAAISGMREQLEAIHSLDEAFKSAERVAVDGEEHLFFPRVASALGQVETLLASLKDQFAAIGGNINNLKQGIDLDKLKSLADSVKQAATTLNASLGTL